MPSAKSKGTGINWVGSARLTRRMASNAGTYEGASAQARNYEERANSGRWGNGRIMAKADRNGLKAGARQLRHDFATRGNDYQYASREQVQAQHGARYRSIRTAFGLAAG